MISSVKDYKHSYVIHQGRIGYVLPEGISYKANFGWKTTFAYLAAVESKLIKSLPPGYASMSVLCCELSYAQLPHKFEYIMGVAETLDMLAECQMKFLRESYRIETFYYLPSIYGKSKVTNMGARIVPEEVHFNEICKAIKAQSNSNRPVLVFFPTLDKAKEFSNFSKSEGDFVIVTEENDLDTVKTRVLEATKPGRVTIATKAFSKGVEFIVGDRTSKQAGGLHIIQTFLSEEKSETVQIMRRTARRGQTGSYELLVNTQQLSRVGLHSQNFKSKDSIELASKIDEACRTSFESAYSGQIKKVESCRKNHAASQRLLENILMGHNELVKTEINRLNKVNAPLSQKVVRTVIGIDATGSMGEYLSIYKGPITGAATPQPQSSSPGLGGTALILLGSLGRGKKSNP